MAKLLPTGRVVSDWKRLPSGLFVPGMRLLPTGRELSAGQQMIQDVYIAAGRKTLELVTVADLGVQQETAALRVSRYQDYSGRTRDWLPFSAATEPSFVASDPTIGNRAFIASTTGTRGLINAWIPPAPGTQPAYVKSVFNFSAWVNVNKMGTVSTVNRYGWRATSPQRADLLNSSTPTGPIDLPINRWGVMTWRLGNSAADFIRFGASANLATGINVGNVAPGTLGKFFTNTATTGITGAEACEFRWSVALTAGEDQAVEDVFNAYYGGSLLKYDSTGNIKPVLVSWFGDSITRHDPIYSYLGFRYSFDQQFFTTNGYPVFDTGSTSNGAWAHPEHSGVSGLGINVTVGAIPTPGAALAFINDHYGAAATSPVNGNGRVQLMHVMIGTNDVGGGLYVPGTTAADYVTLIQRILNICPECLVVGATIIPQLGDPPQVAAFNAELSGVGGAWDVLDAANPTRPIIRYDANAAISAGTGLYNAANYLDALHPNLTGQQLIGAALVAAVTAAMNTKTTY